MESVTEERKLTSNLLKIEEESAFFFQFLNGKLISKISDDVRYINKINITKIAVGFYKYLSLRKLTKKKFLVASSDNKSKVIAFDFFNYLNSHLKDIFILGLDMNPKIENVFSYVNEDFENVIYFSHNEFGLSITIYENNGLRINNRNSNILNLEISKNMDFVYEEKINEEIEKVQWNKDKETQRLWGKEKENTFSFENLDARVILFKNENIKEIIKNIFSGENNHLKFKQYENTRFKNVSLIKGRINSLPKKYEIIYQQEGMKENFEIQVKEKHKFNFFSYNDLSLLYLYYLKKTGMLKNDKVIIKTKDSSKLINEIAKSWKIDVIETNDLFEEIRNSKKEILFATNGTNYFYQNSNRNYLSDSIRNFLLFCHISSFLKKENKNIKDVFKELYEEFFFERVHIEKEKLKPKIATKFFELINKKNKIDDLKITKKEDSQVIKKSKTLMLNLLDGTFISFKYEYDTELLTTFISTRKKNEILDKEIIFECISKEKKIFDFLKEYKEDLDFKKISNKTIIKYLFLVVVFAVLLFVIFNFIYSDIHGIGSKISLIFEKNKYFAFLLPLIILLKFATLFIWAIIPYRIMNFQGYKVKYFHLVISTIIGIVISLITPFSVGGEIVVYWFLRRKGYPRAPLITNVLLLGLIHQVFILVTTIIFIPYGFVTFYNQLFSDNPNSKLSIIFVFLGLFFNIISILFMFSITLSSRFKNLISKFLVSFLEWQPLFIIKDTNKMGGNFKYETNKIHEGVKAVFNKFSNIFEIFCYRLIFSFISVEALFAIIGGLKLESLNDWQFYWDFLVISKFIELANSFSFLPGGLGTGDWLNNVLYEPLFINGQIGTETFNVLNRILFTLLPSLVSGILLIIVSIGEWRIDKYKKIQNLLNNNLIKKTRLFTRYYKIVWIVSLFLLISLLSLYYFFVFKIS